MLDSLWVRISGKQKLTFESKNGSVLRFLPFSFFFFWSNANRNHVSEESSILPEVTSDQIQIRICHGLH